MIFFGIDRLFDSFRATFFGLLLILALSDIVNADTEPNGICWQNNELVLDSVISGTVDYYNDTTDQYSFNTGSSGDLIRVRIDADESIKATLADWWCYSGVVASETGTNIEFSVNDSNNSYYLTIESAHTGTVNYSIEIGSAANNFKVDDDRQQCPDAAYNSIQDAVNHASDGETIEICAGTYSENITISTNNLLIKSINSNRNEVLINGGNSAPVFELNQVSGVQLQSLSVHQGEKSAAIEINTYSLDTRISDLEIISTDDDAVVTNGGNGGLSIDNSALTAAGDGIDFNGEINGEVSLTNTSINAQAVGLKSSRDINGGITLQSVVIAAQEGIRHERELNTGSLIYNHLEVAAQNQGLDFQSNVNQSIEWTDVQIISGDNDAVVFSQAINNGMSITNGSFSAGQVGLSFKQELNGAIAFDGIEVSSSLSAIQIMDNVNSGLTLTDSRLESTSDRGLDIQAHIYGTSLRIRNTEITAELDGIHILENKQVQPDIDGLHVVSAGHNALYNGAPDWADMSLQNSCLTTQSDSYYALKMPHGGSDVNAAGNCFVAADVSRLVDLDNSGGDFDGNYWEGHSGGTFSSGNVIDNNPLTSCPIDGCTDEFVTPLAEYRFEGCDWTTGAIVVDQLANYPGKVVQGAHTALGSDYGGGLCNVANLENEGTDYDRHISLTDNPIPLTGDWTLMMWINFPPGFSNHFQSSGYRYTVIAGGTHDLCWIRQRDSDGYREWGASSNPSAHKAPFPGALTGWHHLAFVGNGTNTDLYVDGAYYNTVDYKQTGSYSRIGTTADPVSTTTRQNLDTQLDELKFYAGALAAEDIASIFQLESSGFRWDGSPLDCQPCLTCFYDDFNRADLGSDWAVSNRGGSFGDPRIVDGRLRMTDSSNNVATAASLLRLFPGAGNKIVYEFDHYAYAGNGADGMAVTLSDAAITPVPGGYGGSLGYAQRCGISGFAGGWLGLGIDEFGNFRNDGECRGDGGSPSGRVLDSIAVRGSGSGVSGYLLHGESGALNPPVDDTGSSTPAYGHRYRVTIDHTDNFHAYTSVERDTGAGYETLIPVYDAKGQPGQAAVPENWLISMTGSTGGSRNIHEIDNLQVCAVEMLPYNSIDHYRFYHDGSALTCAPENIQVKACLNTDCSVEFAGNVQATLTPEGWVGGDSQTFLSGSTLQLWHTTEEDVTLDIAGNRSEFLALHPPRCFIGAAEQADCSLPFYASGFIFDVPDHVAAVTQTVTLSAVRQDPTSEQCVPGFQNVSKQISFWSTYLNPDSGTLPVGINSNSIAGASPGTTLNLNFDTNGQVNIDVAYADVGQMNLNARYEGSGEDAGLLMTGVDAFITRPDHFFLTVPDNPGAGSAAGEVFTAAGESFSVEVSARNASGDVTPNYGRETPAESVQLSQTLLAPAGQHNPPLDGAFDSFGSNCADSSARGYACGEFSWEEVGIIELLPAVADSDYLGCGNVVGTVSGPVGRFIPDRFSVVGNSPQLGHGCTAGSFTSLGQEFAYLVDPLITLTALSVNGNVTINYGDQFWKYGGGLAARNYIHAGPEAVTVVLSTPGAAVLDGEDDYDGSGTVTVVGDRLTYDKPASPLGPFNTLVDLTLTAGDLTDTDDVCYDGNADGNCEDFTFTDIGNSQQRYARFLLQNTYGPETLPLTVPVRTEYYSGSAFVVNDADVCTTYTAADLSLVAGSYTGHLDPGETTASGSGTLSAGLGNDDFSLSAPGAGNDGSVDLQYNLSSFAWLRFDWDGNGTEDDPTVRATFGIFKGNPRLIYMRESIW